MIPVYFVIADDLSGAAEIGGVGFRHGLTAAISSGPEGQGNEQVVVRDLNTRLLPEGEVAAVLGRAFKTSGAVSGRLYKKVDSVLRGHILLELTQLLSITARRRALLVPVNPALGRVIERGIYRIHDVPLHETDFRNDPHHPVRNSSVVEILRRPNLPPVHVVKLDDRLPERGVVVGEARTAEDLREWARRLDDDTIPAGGAAFFEAILNEAGFTECETAWVAPAGLQLLVSGSASAASHIHISNLERRGVPVLRMPEAVFDSDVLPSDALDFWARETISAFERSPLVVVTIGRPGALNLHRGGLLTDHLAGLTRAVLQSVRISQLWIEGGATSFSVVRALGWDRLLVCGLVQGRAVQLVPEGTSSPVLTLKPGSYPWPES